MKRGIWEEYEKSGLLLKAVRKVTCGVKDKMAEGLKFEPLIENPYRDPPPIF